MTDQRYPVGPYEKKQTLTAAERQEKIDQIAAAPAAMRRAVQGLDAGQLDTPYREGGWTLRQVVHHVPDSHMNAYIRLKFALTEDQPEIKAYNEADWAELADSRDTPTETSLTLLESLHGRWVTLMRSMKDSDFQRTLRHPEHGVMTLDMLVNLYAWHGRHHAAQITTLRESQGW